METNNTLGTQKVYKQRPMPSLIEATKTCLLKKYATFSGRARRSEYWWFMLAQYILSFILTIFFYTFVAIQLFTAIKADGDISKFSPVSFLLKNPAFWLSIIVSIALIIPQLAVTVRRFHDIGRSGWFPLLLLIGFPLLFCGIVATIIFVGDKLLLLYLTIALLLIYFALCILLLIWLVKDGQKEANKWGPSPKYYIPEQESVTQ
jgi:uncharacterized membrane protein YhaH (DUF805 family)